MYRFPSDRFLLLALALTLGLSLLRLDRQPIAEWDEARVGINAVEIWRTGDWINPYFAGKPDAWVAKPPLNTWLVALALRFFGYEPFFLRLPALLANLLTVFFLFRLIALYRSPRFALLAVLLLLSVKGFLGIHVGRTGDPDALLLALLTGATFFLVRAVSFERRADWWWMGLLWGLAFWAKGPAAGVLAPGWFLFIVLQGKVKQILANRAFWLGMAAFVALAAGWLGLATRFGLESPEPIFAGRNALERMLSYDLWQRFSESNFEQPQHPSRFTFFFIYLDAHFNVWNYALFGAVLGGLYLWLIRKWQWWREEPLLLLSVACWASLGGLLSLAATTHRWYMAPVLPYLAITTAYGLWWAGRRAVWWRAAIGALLLFTLGRHAWQLAHPGPPPIELATIVPRIQEVAEVYIVPPFPKQDLLLYLYLARPDLRFVAGLDELPPGAQVLMAAAPPNWVVLEKTVNLTFARKPR